ncbi:hypothetical protein Tco_0331754 [Tanacetum coccineum]
MAVVVGSLKVDLVNIVVETVGYVVNVEWEMGIDDVMRWNGRFGQDVGNVIFGGNFFYSDISFLDIVTKEVVTNFYMFGARVKNETYSASMVKIAKAVCFLENHETMVSMPVPLGYHKPRWDVPLMYRKILFMASRWEVFGASWKRAQRQTLNMMSGRLAIS